MVFFINLKEKKIELVSILCDIKVEIVGWGIEEKINYVYVYGGFNMVVKIIEKLMNVLIDYYVMIDMDGLYDMIDILGGVDVVSNSIFIMGVNYFVKGEKIYVDGDVVMDFIRSCKEDGVGGDFGR